MNKKITLFTFLGLMIANLSPYTVYASQTWHSFCSTITVSNSNSSANTINTTNYTVKASDNAAVQMVAQQLTATINNNTLSNDQLQRIVNITSTGILNLTLGHQMPKCNKSYYTDSLTPLLNSLKNGNKVSFTWNNVTIKNNQTSYKAKTLTTQLDGQGNNVHVIIRFSGLSVSSQHPTPSALIPEQGDIDLTTTAQVYPLILAGTSGNIDTTYSNKTLPVTINNLNVRNPQTAITANGNVTLKNKLNLASANGILRITNMEALISACNEYQNTKLKTGLILAKFAGRRVGNNILEWDIKWQGNLFKVNNVPIPVW